MKHVKEDWMAEIEQALCKKLQIDEIDACVRTASEKEIQNFQSENADRHINNLLCNDVTFSVNSTGYPKRQAQF